MGLRWIWWVMLVVYWIYCCVVESMKEVIRMNEGSTVLQWSSMIESIQNIERWYRSSGRRAQVASSSRWTGTDHSIYGALSSNSAVYFDMLWCWDDEWIMSSTRITLCSILIMLHTEMMDTDSDAIRSRIDRFMYWSIHVLIDSCIYWIDVDWIDVGLNWCGMY